jgi:hypothetical protein
VHAAGGTGDARLISFSQLIHVPVKAIDGQMDMSNSARLISGADYTRAGARRSSCSWTRRHAVIGLGDDACGFRLFPRRGGWA